MKVFVRYHDIRCHSRYRNLEILLTIQHQHAIKKELTKIKIFNKQLAKPEIVNFFSKLKKLWKCPFLEMNDQ